MLARYWPDANEDDLLIEDFTVRAVSEEATAYGFLRVFSLTHLISETSREVKQWQYTSWPKASDFGAQQSADVLEMITQIRTYQESKIVLPQEGVYGNASAIIEQARLAQLKPVVVHCGVRVATV